MIERKGETILLEPVTGKPASTVLRVLLRERNLHTYPRFKVAYETAAKSVDKALVGSCPSLSTFKRWQLAGQTSKPHPEHCVVLEVIFPEWSVEELFDPHVELATGTRDSTLLSRLLRERYANKYRAFCRAYDATTMGIDTSMVGRYPASRQFADWLSGNVSELPDRQHCKILEAMFPGYTAAQLFSPVKNSDTVGPVELVKRSGELQESDFLWRIDRSRYDMDRTVAESAVTSAQADKIDQMVKLHARACVTTPPSMMLSRLISDFDELRMLISQVRSPSTLVRLYQAVAEIGALVADEFMVLGDTHRAWAWHHSATTVADMTGLPDLRLQVRSLGILIPLYYSDSHEALNMAIEACDLGKSFENKSSPGYALAITLKALILAQTGLVDECRVALDESGDSFVRLDRSGKIDSVFGFSERRWFFYRARTFAELGDFDGAWEAQDRALALYPDDVVGDPTIIRLDRALCLVRRNEIDAGCELASSTLLSLPAEHRAQIFLRYSKRILDAVPEKYYNHQSVNQYRLVVTDSHQAICV